MLEDEYFWKFHQNELDKVKHKLEINEGKMTKKIFSELNSLIPKEEEKMKKRKKELKKKAEA